MSQINREKTLERAINLADRFGILINDEFKTNGPLIHARGLVIAAIANLIANLMMANNDETLMQLVTSTVAKIIEDHKKTRNDSEQQGKVIQ